MKLALFLLLLSPVAKAEDFQVEVDPQVYSTSDFEGKDVKTGNIPPRVKRPDALPDKRDREFTFNRVPGLDKYVSSLDELDRDVLYVRAKTRPLAELKKRYPNIPSAVLARLRKEAAK